jgi:16S rRNA U516 pseudouridylate synthase RsuA-like enzyme
MRTSKKENLRNVLFRERHPIEKVKRIALADLTIEGIPRGRYRLLRAEEVAALEKSATASAEKKPAKPSRPAFRGAGR